MSETAKRMLTPKEQAIILGAVEKAVERENGRKIVVLHLEFDAENNLIGRGDNIIRMWPQNIP